MSFSKRMKQSREKQGITLAELGRKIGKTEATVQRYESGNIKNLKNDTIENIASALNVNPAYLMGWIDEDPSNEDTIAAHLDGDDFTEEEQDTIAAHFDKEDLTEDEKQEVEDFINYLKSKRK